MENQQYVGIVLKDSNRLLALKEPITLYALCQKAIAQNMGLQTLLEQMASNTSYPYDNFLKEYKILVPIFHPDPTHCIISGTGLTHHNSQILRGHMHEAKEEHLNDAQKVYLSGFKRWKNRHWAKLDHGLNGFTRVVDIFYVQPMRN